MNKESEYLSVTEVAQMLGISIPTLRMMRKTTALGKLEILIGKRVKFSRKAIEEYLKGKNDEVTQQKTPTGQLEIMSTQDTINHKAKKDLIDLRDVLCIDPYGTLSLLIYLIGRSRESKSTELLISTSEACKKLRYVGFFDYIDQFAPLVKYNKKILEGEKYFPPDSLLPITLLRRKGEERRVLEQLNTLFIQQGFSEEIGSYVGWLLGELADNSLTHDGNLLKNKMCFIQAQRYSVGENSKCVVIGIADTGQGIHKSLKQNPKHKKLSDQVAVLSAFRPNVSSWDDEHKRGKGLTDILSIAMGNESLVRVSCGNIDFEFDFQTIKKVGIIRIEPPLLEAQGTRFGVLYIDHQFKKKTREEVDEFLRKEIKRYENIKNE